MVVRPGSDLDRILVTGSDLARRPGLSALSSLPHHLHALCLGLAVVVQYREDDVFGGTMSAFSHRLRCMASNVSSLALELFEEVAGSFNYIWPVLHSCNSEDTHGKYVQSV